MNICDCFTRCFYRSIQKPLLEKTSLLTEDFEGEDSNECLSPSKPEVEDCKLDSKPLKPRIPGELPLPSPPGTPYISSDDDDQFLGGLDEE